MKNAEILIKVNDCMFGAEDKATKLLEVVQIELIQEMEEYWSDIPRGWSEETEELYNHAIQRCIDAVKKVLA